MSTEETAGLTQYIDPEQLKADVEIVAGGLSEAMLKHASLYTHYAIQAVRAQRQYDRWKTALDVLESQLDAQIRQDAASEGKKTTENGIKSAVTNDTRWKACQTRLIEAKQMKELCDAALMCFVHRKDMLLQLARDAASERAGELRVSAIAAGTEASRERLLSAMQESKKAA